MPSSRTITALVSGGWWWTKSGTNVKTTNKLEIRIKLFSGRWNSILLLLLLYDSNTYIAMCYFFLSFDARCIFRLRVTNWSTDHFGIRCVCVCVLFPGNLSTISSKQLINLHAKYWSLFVLYVNCIGTMIKWEETKNIYWWNIDGYICASEQFVIVNDINNFVFFVSFIHRV